MPLPSLALGLIFSHSCFRFVCLAACFYGAVVCEAAPLSDEQEAEIAKKVDSLVSQMTLKEKVGQMRIFHALKGVSSSVDDSLILSRDVKERLKHGIAGIKDPGKFLSPEKAAIHTNKLQKYIIENSRLGIPALFIAEAHSGVDALGTTRFSRPMNMAATWNTELVERIWDTIGREARMRGLHMCHSPEANVMRDPRFSRMSEAYSEDTHLTTEMVVAAVRGVQGRTKGLFAGTHVGAVTKHFVGYGQVEGGLSYSAIQISPRVLRDEIMPPFKAAIQRAGMLGVMVSRGDINGIASHANKALLTGVLRDDWGFNGYVVSDENNIAQLFFFLGVAENAQRAALMSLNAGVDVDLYSDVAYSLLPKLARKNPEIIPMIDRAVKHVLRVKFILGLFENPYVDVVKAAEQTRSLQSLALAREADQESIILLKNKNNLLPLSREALANQTVALIGPVIPDYAEKQFKDMLGDSINLVAEQGFELTDQDKYEPVLLSDEVNQEGFDRAVDTAKQADIVVLFLGGDEFTAKQTPYVRGLGDRASIAPIGLQDELMTKIKALGKPVIVVLRHRRTLAINTIAEHADAILDSWELSEQGGWALAQIMMGDVNPSGKLPVTVPKHIGQIPYHYSQKNINFKKTYLFTKGPLYPFGFGLSYTQFKFSKIKLSKNKMKYGENITATIKVKNIGDMPGKEVVQLYIKDVIGSALRPAKELKAFKKISLKPGERASLLFTITPRMLAFTGLDMKETLESGDFIIEIGASSADTQRAEFSLLKKR